MMRRNTSVRWVSCAAVAGALAAASAVDGGACCYPNGSCVQEEEIECITFHGAYQGDGTLCFGAICPCTGDLNGNDVIDLQDLLMVLANWGGSGVGDIDGDGVVGFPDLMLLTRSWGPCV